MCFHLVHRGCFSWARHGFTVTLVAALPPCRSHDTRQTLQVTDWAAALRLEAEGVVGPTTASGLPPFRWAPQFSAVAHWGQPEVFNFSFEPLARRQLAAVQPAAY